MMRAARLAAAAVAALSNGLAADAAPLTLSHAWIVVKTGAPERTALEQAAALSTAGGVLSGSPQDFSPAPIQTPGPSTLALVGGRIHPAPDSVPIDDGVVVVESGRITIVGPRATTSIPAVERVIDCKGLVVTAAFQNSHVHFTDPRWMDAASQHAGKLGEQLRDMLTRHGFTTVVDTASFLENTLALRRRIESGEVPGPRILTAGFALYPPNGVPYYVREEITPALLKLLPQPTTPDQATDLVRHQISEGADIVKLFVGSWVERGKVLPMPQDVATAATAEAHRHGKLVFVHPSNGAGLEVALRASVDVLAHAVDDTRDTTPDQWARMRRQDVALIPTIKLFGGRFAWDILDEVRDYARAGGQILFGTDVGYLTDFDPTAEYEFMSAAGLSWREILASLTTNPRGVSASRPVAGALRRDSPRTWSSSAAIRCVVHALLRTCAGRFVLAA